MKKDNPESRKMKITNEMVTELNKGLVNKGYNKDYWDNAAITSIPVIGETDTSKINITTTKSSLDNAPDTRIIFVLYKKDADKIKDNLHNQSVFALYQAMSKSSNIITDMSKEEIKQLLTELTTKWKNDGILDESQCNDITEKIGDFGKILCINTDGNTQGSYYWICNFTSDDLMKSSIIVQALYGLGYNKPEHILHHHTDGVWDSFIARTDRLSMCNHYSENIEYSASTCSTEGYYKDKCAWCGNTESGTLDIDSNAHGHVISFQTDNIPEEYEDFASYKTNGCNETIYHIEYCTDCHTEILKEECGTTPDHNYTKVSVVPGTCTTIGTITYECTVCGDRKTENTDYDFDNHTKDEIRTVEDATCEESGYRQHYCSDCESYFGEREELEELGHDWEQVSNTTGDCVTASSVAYRCSRCGKEKTETSSGDMKIHNPNYIVKEITKKATCKEEGEEVTKCTHCNEIISKTTLPKTEHSYRSKVTTKATCSKQEVVTHTCTVCGDSYTTTGSLNSNNHGETTEIIIKEPTCIEMGTKEIRCNDCNALLSTKSIPKIDHKTETKIIKEPTCKAYGLQAEVCTICGKQISTKQIAKKSHTPIVNEEGTSSCSICGEVLGYMITYDTNGGECDKLTDYGATGTVISLPTPTKEGYTFNGWYNEKGKKVTSLKLTSNITLTAKWTTKSFKITFNANGGKSSRNVIMYKYGDKVTLPNATRNGYTFEGWYVNDVLLNDTTISSLDKSVVAKAKWTKITIQVYRIKCSTCG